MRLTVKKTTTNQSYLLPAVFLIISLLISCVDTESDLDIQIKEDDEKITTYLTNNQITATKLDDGFYYLILNKDTSGQSLQTGDVVDFYYKISLLDGSVIDESIESRDTISQFRLGYWSIMPIALDYGIAMMKTGEKYRFFVPSYLAFYHITGLNFPGFSNFIIDIEVLGKTTETQIDETQLDSIQNYVESNKVTYEKFATGLFYIPKLEGTGDKPFKGNNVTVNFTRKYLDGKVIKKTPAGEPSVFYIDDKYVVEGLGEGLLQMQEGGKATLIMPASIGFKQSICVVPESMRSVLIKQEVINMEVIPYSIIMYDVELVSVND